MSAVSAEFSQASEEAPPAHQPGTDFGANEWLVDELYQRYQADPASVDRAWWNFFADYRPEPSDGGGQRTATAAAAAQPSAPAAATVTDLPLAARPQAAQAGTAVANGHGGQQPSAAPEPGPDGPVQSRLRGAAARTVVNMEASLAVPTATSVRAVPAKLLVDNRIVINNHLARGRGGKVSFTHLIGYAIVKALAAAPELNESYADVDGKPMLVKPKHINLGLAIDVRKDDGSRQLLVPSIKATEQMDFRQFWLSYEEVVRKARAGRLAIEDFAGTTISLTNPGTIGTVHSVPRLMQGQGCIIGVGAMEYPAAYQGASAETLARDAISQTVTLTSTYDHRIIQGAQSGELLRIISGLLLGDDGFYDSVFASLRIPYEPVRWVRDIPAGHENDISKAARVHELIHAYRVRGHLLADTDPLQYTQRKHPDLDINQHGLTLWDLEREFATGGFGGKPRMLLREILGVLRDAYCRTVGVEYMHIQNPQERAWLQARVERSHSAADHDEQMRILSRLNVAEAFEMFLQTKYVGQRRFSLEGAESLIPLLDAVLGEAGRGGLHEAVVGMAHRGRLNVLANIVGKSYGQIFNEFEGYVDPGSTHGSGDVKYHLGADGKYKAADGTTIPVSLVANPSHLEAVDPVLEGVVRAKQDLLDIGTEGFTVLPILIHGDAAFAGQGVVAETLELSQLRGYRTGGTVHIVVNNQVGFTTDPQSSRSSVYSTDVARTIQAPIFHVNGDDPEAVVRVGKLAFAYRETFAKDVVIDMVCYRRRGHNEADNPSFTQPLMYDIIDTKRSTRKLYTESLIGRGDITLDEAEHILRDYQAELERAFTETKEAASQPPQPGAVLAEPPAQPMQIDHSSVPTAISSETIKRVIDTQLSLPGRIHPASSARTAIGQAGSHGGAGRDRLGDGRVAGLRLDPDRRPRRPAGRSGHQARHLRSATCRPGRPAHRRGVHPAARTQQRHRQVPRLRFAIVRVRRCRIRVRLLGSPTRCAGLLGGAIRRLRQRSSDHHGRIHLIRRAEVGPALRRSAAAPARLRRPRPGPLLRPSRALLVAVRPGQHDRGDAEQPSELLPPTALAGVVEPDKATGHFYAKIYAPPQGSGICGSRVHRRVVPPGGR